jgi:iron complex transport system permease protein
MEEITSMDDNIKLKHKIHIKLSMKNRVIMVIILLILLFILSLSVGRYGITLSEFLQIIASKLFGIEGNYSKVIETVLFKVRLPRMLAAIFVGGALAMAGATYQGLFRNPMVSPDLLGASAGAGFGAAIALLFNFSILQVQISSFVFGIGAVFLTYLISSIISTENSSTLTLVLTGMVISTLFASFISMIKYVADPYSKLPNIIFWLMGGLSSVKSSDVIMMSIPIVIGVIPIVLLRWKLNVLTFGEEEAQAMGINTKRIRVVFILCATLMTSAAVATSGMIGWVGLVIPHLVRMIVGPNYKILLPTSALVGSLYLLLIDDIARSLFSIEIPLGILTSLIGAPFFIYLLLKGKKGWV